ncbi:MAG TPA: hypothetical protein VGO91_09585 [Pyrinomonadaceae bacterium]|jgi:hypothetical protein|nr:hypothetical protein [Pyrinomonadaceae bacterium]
MASETQQTKAKDGEALPPTRKVSLTTPLAGGRGIALDLTVIAANLFLLAPLARLLRAEGQGFLAPGPAWSKPVSPTVGRLFLSVFAAHALGAYLKRLPRQARLAPPDAEGETDPASISQTGPVYVSTRRRRLQQLWPRSAPPHKILIGIVLSLLLFHFFIFLMLLFAGWQGTGLESWVSIVGKAQHEESAFIGFLVRFVLVCFILPLPTALVAWSLRVEPGSPSLNIEPDLQPSTWRTHWATELLADLLLYFSIIVLTVILNVLIAPRFMSVEGSAGWTLGNMLASLVPMALAFSIFYLPPRLIYLAEDYKSPVAWLTILLALMSLAYNTFFAGQAFSW